MKVFKVTVSKDDKEYLSVLPIIGSNVEDKAKKLHEEIPHGTITVYERDDGEWNEVWIINPEVED